MGNNVIIKKYSQFIGYLYKIYSDIDSLKFLNSMFETTNNWYIHPNLGLVWLKQSVVYCNKELCYQELGMPQIYY